MTLPDLVFETPLWLGLVTVGVAALEGAVIGRESRSPRYDITGVLVLAITLGLAGGILRDVLIGNLPVMAIRTPWYIVTVAGVAAVVIVAGRYIPSLGGMWFVVLDALTLGLYTAIATGYALQAGLPVVGALFVGVAAGVVGGVLVALLRGAPPAILMPGVFYAVIAFLGACVYALIEPVAPAPAALACVGLVVAARVVAVRWRLGTTPLPLLGHADGES